MPRPAPLFVALCLFAPLVGCDTGGDDPPDLTPSEPVALATAAVPGPVAVSPEFDLVYTETFSFVTSTLTYFSIRMDGTERRVLSESLGQSPDLEVDGVRLYGVAEVGGGDRALFRLNPGGEPDELSEFDRQVQQFTLVDDHQQVLYYAERGDGSPAELRLRDLASEEDVLLVTDLPFPSGQRFLPDGTFTASPDGANVLFLTAAETGEGYCERCRGLVVDVAGRTAAPYDLPHDALRARWLDGRLRALTLEEQAEAVQPIVRAFVGGGEEAFEPIALETDRGGLGGFLDFAGPLGNVDWSADGERVVFWRLDRDATAGTARYRLQERELSTGEERTLTEFDLQGGNRPYALWYAPGGDYVLYWRPDDGGLVLYSLRLG